MKEKIINFFLDVIIIFLMIFPVGLLIAILSCIVLPLHLIISIIEAIIDSIRNINTSWHDKIIVKLEELRKQNIKKYKAKNNL